MQQTAEVDPARIEEARLDQARAEHARVRRFEWPKRGAGGEDNFADNDFIDLNVANSAHTRIDQDFAGRELFVLGTKPSKKF